jgi:hypothetical protein
MKRPTHGVCKQEPIRIKRGRTPQILFRKREQKPAYNVKNVIWALMLSFLAGALTATLIVIFGAR